MNKKIFNDNEVKQILSQKIKSARKDTQEKTAEEAGISSDALSLIERGITVPTTTNIINIFNVLDLKPNDFFEDFISNDNKTTNEKLNNAFDGLSGEEKSFILYIIEYIKSHRS